MDDVNATAVDVVIIIKMAEKIKTIVLEGKVADGGKDGLGRYVFFYWIFRRVYSYELIYLEDS